VHYSIPLNRDTDNSYLDPNLNKLILRRDTEHIDKVLLFLDYPDRTEVVDIYKLYRALMDIGESEHLTVYIADIMSLYRYTTTLGVSTVHITLRVPLREIDISFTAISTAINSIMRGEDNLY